MVGDMRAQGYLQTVKTTACQTDSQIQTATLPSAASTAKRQEHSERKRDRKKKINELFLLSFCNHFTVLHSRSPPAILNNVEENLENKDAIDWEALREKQKMKISALL